MFCLYYNCHFQKRCEDKKKSGGILERKKRPDKPKTREDPSPAPFPGPRPSPTSTEEHPALPERRLKEGPCRRSPPCFPSGIWSRHKCYWTRRRPHRRAGLYTPTSSAKRASQCSDAKTGETTEQRGKGNWSLKQRFLD